jgi:hypothetical protein
MTANQVQQGSSAWFLSFRFSLGLVRMRSNPDRAFGPHTSYNAEEPARIPDLKQDLPGLLVGKDLSLYPLERVIDGLRVAF